MVDAVLDEEGELVIRSPPETKTKINPTVVTTQAQVLKSPCPSIVSCSGVLGEHMQTWLCCLLQLPPHLKKTSIALQAVAFQTAYH